MSNPKTCNDPKVIARLLRTAANVSSDAGHARLFSAAADLLDPPAQLRCSAESAGLPFQKRVVNWLMECFSMDVCRDGTERNHRFLEESLELVQSLGCTASEAYQLVDYVFSRPVGEPDQELGGVQVTLAALCFPHDLDMDAARERELARVWTKIDKAKPKHSPLPEHVPTAAQPTPAWRAVISFALRSARVYIGNDDNPRSRRVLQSIKTAVEALEGCDAAQPPAAPVHASDCSLHNGPALPPGACDCDARSSAGTGVEDVARTICLSYGRDPDDMTSILEMCTADNKPVPVWRVYEEQAEAVIAKHLITREPQTLPKRPHSIYSKYHLDNWLDSDFAAHAAATRKTLAYLIELEAALALTRPERDSDGR